MLFITTLRRMGGLSQVSLLPGSSAHLAQMRELFGRSARTIGGSTSNVRASIKLPKPISCAIRMPDRPHGVGDHLWDVAPIS
ncbi:hypothetical protein AMJ96_PA00209 (plasmid) [Rhizobium sp. N113]|nr:hypothetical protein AMJ96_PA00209 [Rhizobium sp. N113]